MSKPQNQDPSTWADCTRRAAAIRLLKKWRANPGFRFDLKVYAECGDAALESQRASAARTLSARVEELLEARSEELERYLEKVAGPERRQVPRSAPAGEDWQDVGRRQYGEGILWLRGWDDAEARILVDPPYRREPGTAGAASGAASEVAAHRIHPLGVDHAPDCEGCAADERQADHQTANVSMPRFVSSGVRALCADLMRARVGIPGTVTLADHREIFSYFLGADAAATLGDGPVRPSAEGDRQAESEVTEALLNERQRADVIALEVVRRRLEEDAAAVLAGISES